MTVHSFFESIGGLQIADVEVKLLPGLPRIHIVGQPDAHIKECGLRIKSGLRSSGFKWPRGRQIVVNLRPTYLKKHSRGLELAIIVGILIESGQAPREFLEWCRDKIFYGEIGLNGEIFAPEGVVDIIRPGSEYRVVTGPASNDFLEGEWMVANRIIDLFEPDEKKVSIDWEQVFVRPELLPYDFSIRAAELMRVAALTGSSTLIMGPQGTGKSTFARALHGLTAKPLVAEFRERRQMTGERLNWRPLETPHHSIPLKAMLGGGSPVQPGVISRAHGGMLIMDEFLRFDSAVVESLREPLESGVVHVDRLPGGVVLPSKFQLVGTTNLCPCGMIAPGMFGRRCNHLIPRCKSVWSRLSGPILDRFDLFAFSTLWMEGPRLALADILADVEQARVFAGSRAEVCFDDSSQWPQSVRELVGSFRRKRALMRIARAIADLEGSVDILDRHFGKAKDLCLHPLLDLEQLYG